MQTRYVDKSGPITRGKRSLDGDEEQQSDMKRPALASVIVEALKVDNLQKLCSSLEPILRRVVSEEVERALAKIGPSMLNGRSSPKRIEGPDGRKLQLQFRSRLSLPLFTGARVEGEQGAAIHVVLVDANTGHVVISGPESVAKLEIIVLEGDFCNEDDEGWSQEEFESHVVREREGKRPLLTGDLLVTLKEGVGTLGELTFTDNSSWIRSRKFRLGLKAASGSLDGVRVREAKTEAFTVKDHRGELYKKHYPPALNDEVWRLEKVGKDGAFHKKLNSFGILVVEDFLRVLVRDAQKLRNMLGSGMSNKMWDALVDHAKTCVLSGKHYVYYADNSRLVGVVFNNIYELSGLISSGDQYFPSDILSESQKVYVDNLVKKAYDNWHEVVEYDGKSLLGFRENSSRSSDSGNELTMGSIDYSNTMENPLQSTCHSDHSEQFSSNLGIPVDGGYTCSNKLAVRYLPHTLTSDPHGHFEASVGYPIDETRPDRTAGFALGRPNPSSISPLSEFHHALNPTTNPLDDCWYNNNHENTRQKQPSEDILTEEEIRARSHEMLENEDIQQLLRIWSMGGNNGYVNGADTGYPFSSFIPPTPPAYAYSEEERIRSGRAVVGWLKIKAAMRWGFFIRKKAAERRAQIVEIHDEDDDDDR